MNTEQSHDDGLREAIEEAYDRAQHDPRMLEIGSSTVLCEAIESAIRTWLASRRPHGVEAASLVELSMENKDLRERVRELESAMEIQAKARLEWQWRAEKAEAKLAAQYAIIERSGYDVTLCADCGEPTITLPDGMPAKCAPCWKKILP